MSGILTWMIWRQILDRGMGLEGVMNRFHEDAPKRLIAAVQKAGSERKFARECGINQSYVSQLLHRGIEPGNPEIRVKLFLPAKRIKHREQKLDEFPGQKRIKKII